MSNWLANPDPSMLARAREVPPPPFAKSTSWRLKRLLDVLVSGCILVGGLPLILLACALIWLTSGWPVFFRQERVSHRGRRFHCVKFRTMRASADPTPHLILLDRLIAGREELPAGSSGDETRYKLTGDRRVTGLGRLLRKTSADELPQMWNVLRGEMSLVGPQAPLPFEVERYRPEWLRRLAVPAGLTGPWQVYGRARVPYARMIEMDLEYVDNWSLKWDVGLLLATVPAAISGRGAH